MTNVESPNEITLEPEQRIEALLTLADKAVSILESHYPVDTKKRFIHELGNRIEALGFIIDHYFLWEDEQEQLSAYVRTIEALADAHRPPATPAHKAWSEESPAWTAQETALSDTEAILDVWMLPETLDALIALVTEEEAVASPLRTEATLALRQLKTLLDKLKGSPAYASLEARRSVVGKAVGMINGGKVDHTRG